MRPTSQFLSLLLLLQCISHLSIQISAADNLQKGQNLTDGETLVSAGGSFTLGFFSPGVSTKRYLGIWFSESNDTVYWVANRDDPLGERSGMLVFNDAGSLVLLDGSRRIAWSSDFPGSASASAVQLLESGNLVVRNGSNNASLWQAFDHPYDTFLPGMKLGKNLRSGAEWQLTSWRSANDPSQGNCGRTLETSGQPHVSVDTGVTLEECKARCYADGSCLAYAAAYIQEGGDGTGCVIWADTIVDLRLVDRGQNLYMRLSKSEFDDLDGRKIVPILLAVAPIASAVTVLLAIFLIVCRMRRRILDNETEHLIRLCKDRGAIPQNPSMAVHPVNLATIKHVTRNFSRSNIIGEGRFGVVYKAQLAGGRTIAIKRLKQSALTKKGKKDFAGVVGVLAGLRHRSLVRLLAYCNQGKERILVYEYMENNSLEVNIFDQSSHRASLDWARRLEIIQRIAHGVAYLHGGSGEILIHGNLKPGNILLDDEWKAKIADFGTTKLFAVDQMRPDQTTSVSPGYATPEYEQRSEMALKCDVYSFGVIILEILSGQKNGGTQSLVSHVRRLCEQNNIMELLDRKMELPYTESNHKLLTELKSCIEVGLHCVREMPGDRPDMSDIVAMLTSTTPKTDLPRHPTIDSMVTSWSRDHENDL